MVVIQSYLDFVSDGFSEHPVNGWSAFYVGLGIFFAIVTVIAIVFTTIGAFKSDSWLAAEQNRAEQKKYARLSLIAWFAGPIVVAAWPLVLVLAIPIAVGWLFKTLIVKAW